MRVKTKKQNKLQARGVARLTVYRKKETLLGVGHCNVIKWSC